MHAFRDAINLVVPEGSKVLKLGGGTRVLSFFAAQKASKVWCVERNPAMVRAAKQFPDRNAGGERVQVVQAGNGSRKKGQSGSRKVGQLIRG